MHYHYSFHLLDWVWGIEDGAGEGDAIDAGLHYGRDVGEGDTSYGYDWDVNALGLHLGDDVLVTFETEYRGETLLGGGETEWSATDVIGGGTIVGEDIFECVCRATDDEVIAEDAPCFGYWHIFLSEMYSVSVTFAYEFHVVVDDECGLISVA